MKRIVIENEEHWHRIRKEYIGGSEVAGLFGASSYLTALELYMVKRGLLTGEIEDNERMFWGRMVEDAIAQGVAKKMGWKVENPKAYFVCEDTPGMGCTPDRVIYKPERPDPGLLQIKNVDGIAFKKWADDENGQKVVPLDKQLQVQHELACAGYEWGVLAVLVGGNSLKLFHFDAHPGAIKKIKGAINDFWQAVRSEVPPTAAANDYEILKDFYPNVEHKIIDLTGDNELPGLCATVMEAAERRKAADKEEKAAKAQILQKIGDAGRAICSGFIINKTTVRKKEYVVRAQEYQQLTIKEGA